MTKKELDAGAEMLQSTIGKINKLKDDKQLTGYQEPQLVLMVGLTSTALDIARQLTRIADVMETENPQWKTEVRTNER